MASLNEKIHTLLSTFIKLYLLLICVKKIKIIIFVKDISVFLYNNMFKYLP